MHDVADQYGCNEYIKYNHSIKHAAWDESKGKWDIEVQDGNQKLIHEEADVFVNAGGVLK
jgi:cation diffusion facilitator CzcD-associated flavoprotein CzcO